MLCTSSQPNASHQRRDWASGVDISLLACSLLAYYSLAQLLSAYTSTLDAFAHCLQEIYELQSFAKDCKTVKNKGNLLKSVVLSPAETISHLLISLDCWLRPTQCLCVRSDRSALPMLYHCLVGNVHNENMRGSNTRACGTPQITTKSVNISAKWWFSLFNSAVQCVSKMFFWGVKQLKLKKNK